MLSRMYIERLRFANAHAKCAQLNEIIYSDRYSELERKCIWITYPWRNLLRTICCGMHSAGCRVHCLVAGCFVAANRFVSKFKRNEWTERMERTERVARVTHHNTLSLNQFRTILTLIALSAPPESWKHRRNCWSFCCCIWMILLTIKSHRTNCPNIMRTYIIQWVLLFLVGFADCCLCICIDWMLVKTQLSSN